MLLRAGTSGYSYPRWRGRFYPEKLKSAEMLAFYATHFSTVEINNTFYRMPKAELLEHWAAEVRARPDFVFVLKAPQRITHIKRLTGVEDDLRHLLETAAVLGPAFGPLLFQTPPFLKRDLPRLQALLELLQGRRAAFEFRHPSWDDAEVGTALAAAQAARVVADTDEAPLAAIPAAPTPWGYLRLRRTVYDDDALAAWALRVREQPWREAFVFFKHEDEGTGPAYAAAFQRHFAAGSAD